MLEDYGGNSAKPAQGLEQLLDLHKRCSQAASIVEKEAVDVPSIPLSPPKAVAARALALKPKSTVTMPHRRMAGRTNLARTVPQKRPLPARQQSDSSISNQNTKKRIVDDGGKGPPKNALKFLAKLNKRGGATEDDEEEHEKDEKNDQVEEEDSSSGEEEEEVEDQAEDSGDEEASPAQLRKNRGAVATEESPTRRQPSRRRNS